MKRLSKKATSLIMALILVFSLSATAFANDIGSSLTRAEVTQEVIKNMGLSAQAETSAKETSAFKDVAESSKYEGAINLAYSKGIVNGVSKDSFAPDAAVTQLEAAAMVLRSTGMDKALLSAWPADYDDMAVWSGLMDGLTYEAAKPVTMAMLEQMLKNAAAIADKPVIGISWSYNGQDYDSHKTIFKTVGAIPVELDQVTSTAVKYDAEGKIESAYLEESGMLKQTYADMVKKQDISTSNVSSVMKAIDGVFFTGYHSGAGMDANPLAHTMNRQNRYVRVNGTIAPELMINSLTAARFGVPVRLVTGDRGLCEWMHEQCPGTQTVAVSEGVGRGSISIHPDKAIRLIREAAERAAKTDARDCMFPLPGHFRVEVGFKEHFKAKNAASYPGVTQTSPTEIAFECGDWLDALRMLDFTL